MSEQEFYRWCERQNVYELERSFVAAGEMLAGEYDPTWREKWQTERRILREVIDKKWAKVRSWGL